jgi:hypothetical protein
MFLEDFIGFEFTTIFETLDYTPILAHNLFVYIALCWLDFGLLYRVLQLI